MFGAENYSSVDDVFMEIVGKLPKKNLKAKFNFNISKERGLKAFFNNGADCIEKRFDDEFDG